MDLPRDDADDLHATQATQADPDRDLLPSGTRLSGVVVVEALSQDLGGIVYLAEDPMLRRHLLLREHFPLGLVRRGDDGQVLPMPGVADEARLTALSAFLSGARLLGQFDHPSIARVLQVWQEHGTAYQTVPYAGGSPLAAHLHRQARAPSEAWLQALLIPLLSALGEMHRQGIYHLGVSTETIWLSAAERPLLVDLATAGPAPVSRKSDSIDRQFAPIELFSHGSELPVGAWTDLYGVAAVLHQALLGQPPTSAAVMGLRDQHASVSDRLASHTAADRPSVSFLKAIDQALAVNPQDRPQSVAAFEALLGLTVAPIVDPGVGAKRVAPPSAWKAAGLKQRTAQPSATPGINPLKLPDPVLAPAAVRGAPASSTPTDGGRLSTTEAPALVRQSPPSIADEDGRPGARSEGTAQKGREEAPSLPVSAAQAAQARAGGDAAEGGVPSAEADLDPAASAAIALAMSSLNFNDPPRTDAPARPGGQAMPQSPGAPHREVRPMAAAPRGGRAANPLNGRPVPREPSLSAQSEGMATWQLPAKGRGGRRGPSVAAQERRHAWTLSLLIAGVVVVAMGAWSMKDSPQWMAWVGPWLGELGWRQPTAEPTEREAVTATTAMPESSNRQTPPGGTGGSPTGPARAVDPEALLEQHPPAAGPGGGPAGVPAGTAAPPSADGSAAASPSDHAGAAGAPAATTADPAAAAGAPPAQASRQAPNTSADQASPSAPAAVAGPAPTPADGFVVSRSPRGACGDRMNFSLYRCMELQCQLPRFVRHPQCIKFRADGEP